MEEATSEKSKVFYTHNTYGIWKFMKRRRKMRKEFHSNKWARLFTHLRKISLSCYYYLHLHSHRFLLRCDPKNGELAFTIRYSYKVHICENSLSSTFQVKKQNTLAYVKFQLMKISNWTKMWVSGKGNNPPYYFLLLFFFTRVNFSRQCQVAWHQKIVRRKKISTTEPETCTYTPCLFTAQFCEILNLEQSLKKWNKKT